MKTTRLFFGTLLSIALAACGGNVGNEGSAGLEGGSSSGKPPAATGNSSQPTPAVKGVPRSPYSRLLPLELIAPTTAQAGVPLVGVSVNLLNPGADAPDARLRLTIHYTDYRDSASRRELNSDNVRIEVLEGETWKPVLLGVVDGGVMGAIGEEGVKAHQERHRRGGFALPAGLSKSWQLRVTFDLPGTYTLISAVSPDNGSRHLSQPAHSTIVVQ